MREKGTASLTFIGGNGAQWKGFIFCFGVLVGGRGGSIDIATIKINNNNNNNNSKNILTKSW